MRFTLTTMESRCATPRRVESSSSKIIASRPSDGRTDCQFEREPHRTLCRKRVYSAAGDRVGVAGVDSPSSVRSVVGFRRGVVRRRKTRAAASRCDSSGNTFYTCIQDVLWEGEGNGDDLPAPVHVRLPSIISYRRVYAPSWREQLFFAHANWAENGGKMPIFVRPFALSTISSILVRSVRTYACLYICTHIEEMCEYRLPLHPLSAP